MQADTQHMNVRSIVVVQSFGNKKKRKENKEKLEAKRVNKQQADRRNKFSLT